MSSKRAGELLRQILANPDDMAVRAVYADELLAAGDPRGELIAIGHPGTAELATRRAELLATHASTWWPELSLDHVDTRGGFVERIAATEHELGHATHLLRTEPISSIELLESHGAAFADAPWHARVRSLVVREVLGPNALRAMLGSRLAATLRSLDLAGCSGIDRDIVPFGDALPNCRELVLADNVSLGRHLPRLLDWAFLDRLERLDLSRCSVTDHVLAALLERDLPNLRVLRLSQNPLEATGAEMLARALPRLPALRRVEAVGCGVVAPPGVITEVTDLGDRVTIDLVSMPLQLVRTRDVRWAIEIDGVRRPVRWQVGRSIGDTQRVVVDWQVAHDAPLDALAVAVLTGASRSLLVRGAYIRPGTTSAYAYSTHVESRQSVTIEQPPPEGPVSIRLWEHVDVD